MQCFLIKKALEGITIEKPDKISFTRDGNRLILKKSLTQSNKLLKATNISSLCTSKVELHSSLNIRLSMRAFCSTPISNILTEEKG